MKTVDAIGLGHLIAAAISAALLAAFLSGAGDADESLPDPDPVAAQRVTA